MGRCQKSNFDTI